MSLLEDVALSWLDSKAQKKGEKQVIGAYQGAQDQSINALTGARDASLGYYQPYATGGAQAFGQAQNMLTPGFKYTPADPSYAFRMSQGVNALDRSAASRGSLNSGGQLKALTQFGQDLGSTEFGKDFDRQTALAKFGYQAADDMAGTQNGYAANVSNALYRSADGRAGGYRGKADAKSDFYGNVGGSLDQAEQTLASFFGF